MQLLPSLIPIEASDAVECGGLVALGEGGIVKNCIDEVVNRSAKRHNGLADMNELRSSLADDVNAEDLARVTVEDQLEPASGVPANLSPCSLTIVGHSNFVRDVFVGELFLSFPNEADFGLSLIHI